MKSLNAEEMALISRRKEGFDQFLSERMPVLIDFFGRMGHNDPVKVLNHPFELLQPLSEFLEHQDINSEFESKSWIIPRIGYFIGEYFIAKYQGIWFLNDIPGSKYFSQYVVGSFHRISNKNAMISPFDLAIKFVNMPVPRNLSQLIADVELELKDWLMKD